jgi:hypothetical protein
MLGITYLVGAALFCGISWAYLANKIYLKKENFSIEKHGDEVLFLMLPCLLMAVCWPIALIAVLTHYFIFADG